MSSKHSKLTKFWFFAVALACVSRFGHADDFQYFNKGVDYWNELKADKSSSKEPSPNKSKEAVPNVEKPPIEVKNEKFPWEQYLDPKNKEFFKEGDYTPPEPFMELVREPSDQNMKMWFTYIEKKNELSMRLQQRMAEYVAKNGLATPDDQKAIVTKMKAPSTENIDIKRYRFRMYFSSTCPHCQKMSGTLSELQAKGFFVEARQIDKDGTPPRFPFPTEMASPSEIKIKEIQSVPLLLIGDLKRKVVLRVTGYKTTAEVLEAVKQQERGS